MITISTVYERVTWTNSESFTAVVLRRCVRIPSRWYNWKTSIRDISRATGNTCMRCWGAWQCRQKCTFLHLHIINGRSGSISRWFLVLKKHSSVHRKSWQLGENIAYKHNIPLHIYMYVTELRVNYMLSTTRLWYSAVDVFKMKALSSMHINFLRTCHTICESHRVPRLAVRRRGMLRYQTMATISTICILLIHLINLATYMKAIDKNKYRMQAMRSRQEGHVLDWR